MQELVRPIGLAFRILVQGYRLQQGLDCGAGKGLGEELGQFWAADQLHRIRGQLFTRIERRAQHIPGGRGGLLGDVEAILAASALGRLRDE